MTDRHLDVNHLILSWIKESRIVSGYIFRRISADDRISIEDKSLVSNNHCQRYQIEFANDRIKKCSQNIFAAIFWISRWIQFPMIHIHSEETIVNIFLQKDIGAFENYVIGEDGVWILIISQLFVIL